MFKDFRHYSCFLVIFQTLLPYHSKCLTTTGLPIRENRAIIATKSAFNNWEGCLIVNFLLCTTLVKHFIKPERFIVIFSTSVQIYLTFFFVDLDWTLLIFFPFDQRAASDNDFDTFIEIPWFFRPIRPCQVISLNWPNSSLNNRIVGLRVGQGGLKRRCVPVRRLIWWATNLFRCKHFPD